MKEEDKDLNYWKENAEECYMTTPIGVLRYITELEKVVENNAVSPLVSNSLLSLDGKSIPVTFHVSKFEPKIDIDLSNDC